MDHSPTPPDRTSRLRLALSLAADWERIETVRQAVSLGIGAALDDAELAERMAMVSAELLENAVKHGRPDPITFCLEEDGGQVTVSVRNPIVPERGLSALHERLRWMATFPDPQEAYLAAMAEVYGQGKRTGGALGLVRIAFEGSCQLAYDASEPGFVVVRARYSGPSAAEESP